MESSHLFENIKYCTVCHRPMPLDYERDICPVCEENELFSRVKDFIRSKDVTEYQVADEFNIPLRKVKGWIKEGRIEYKEMKHETIQELRCAACGKPIQFGAYCQECFKLKNMPKAAYVNSNNKKEDNKMRFLE